MIVSLKLNVGGGGAHDYLQRYIEGLSRTTRIAMQKEEAVPETGGFFGHLLRSLKL